MCSAVVYCAFYFNPGTMWKVEDARPKKKELKAMFKSWIMFPTFIQKHGCNTILLHYTYVYIIVWRVHHYLFRF